MPHMGDALQQVEFVLDRDFIELNQLLKLAGLADSGGAGKALVASGGVRVDGIVELRKTAKIRVGQAVRLDSVEIRVLAP
jgi:ribosome-associated protein